MVSGLNFNDDKTINNFSPDFRDIILNRNINNLNYFRERKFNNFFYHSEIGSINSIDKVGNNNTDIVKTSLQDEAKIFRPNIIKNNKDNSIYFNNLGFNNYGDLKDKIGDEYSIDKVGNNNEINLLSIDDNLDVFYFQKTYQNRYQSTDDNIANRYDVNSKSYSYNDTILEREYTQNGNTPSVNYSNEEIREILSRRNIYENFEFRSYNSNSQINLTPNEQFNYLDYYNFQIGREPNRFPLISNLLLNNPNDKLSKIGREELQRHATQRALTALKNKTNSLTELSVSRIIGATNGNFILNNEPITVPGDASSATRIIDYGARMLGAVNPFRVLPKTIELDGFSSKQRSDKLLSRTSLQSRKFINNNLIKNKYQPDYNFQNGKLINEDNNKLYNLTKGLYNITKGNNKNPSNLNDLENDFKTLVDLNRNSTKFSNKVSWDDNETFLNVDDKFLSGDGDLLDIKSETKSFLLTKTRKLFKDGHIDTLIDRKSLKTNINTEIETPATNKEVSKGSGVLNNDEFCRVFTKNGKRYDSISNLQGNKGLTDYNNKYTGVNQNKNSVLGENGFVKSAPTDNLDGLKKYMFSIENLAWSGYLKNLPKLEKGNGDENGVKGRIMWFPPYIDSINDNSSANWNSEDFIGRGESVYTYINSNRTINLSFKIVVDHPDKINDDRYKGVSDNDYMAYVAGCSNDLTEVESPDTIGTDVKMVTETKSSSVKPDEVITVYFPNNSSNIKLITKKNGYESSNVGIREYIDDSDVTQIDTKGNSLNTTFLSKLHDGKLLDEFSNSGTNTITIELASGATKLGGDEINNELVENRIKNVKQYLTNLSKKKNINIKFSNNYIITTNNTSTTDFNNLTDKKGRFTQIKLRHVIEGDDTVLNNTSKSDNDISDNILTSVNKETEKEFYDEAKYFANLDDNLINKQFKDRIKHFHPSFHSITPQGFNHRLTFLHQCLRQGPTIDNSNNNKADNLVFGKQPVCILRVGDFYHTKCIITSLNIDYEPLVWDLNKDGIGVQPMLANVTLSLNIIGGSSLSGAISRLQNSVSFNFFANTQVFDERSDYIDGDNQIKRGKTLKREKN